MKKVPTFYQGEKLKVIDGFPGYWITSHGRMFYEKANRDIVQKKIQRNQLGYGIVTLYNKKEGFRHSFVYSTLMMRTFGPPKPTPTSVVSYRDGDKTNFHIDNLIWREMADTRPGKDAIPVKGIVDGVPKVWESRHAASKELGVFNTQIERAQLGITPLKNQNNIIIMEKELIVKEIQNILSRTAGRDGIRKVLSRQEELRLKHLRNSLKEIEEEEEEEKDMEE